MNYDEILDVISCNDEVIRQEKRTIIYERGLYFRVINGFICNSNRKLWIPRRHPNKKLFPLHLDASVGGHVLSGETYDNAFLRETKEELGLDPLLHNYKKIARLTPMTHNTSAFMWVYIMYSDNEPNYNTNDFIEYNWFSIDEVFYHLKNGDKAKGDLIPILNTIKDKL